MSRVSSGGSRGDADTEVPLVWHEGDVILDPYEVTAVNRTGGMGVVYRVRHLGWGMDLAVNVPRPELCSTDEQVRKFERECEAWVQLGLHAHTVSCVYVRRWDGVPRVFGTTPSASCPAGRMGRRRQPCPVGHPTAALRRRSS